MDKENLDRIRKSIKGELFFYDCIDSTNAAALNNKSAPDKSLFIAANQINGRGRQNRKWEASEGGIYMTILLKPSELSAEIPIITLMAGLAVSRAIPDSYIKWPNDIILGNKKVAGILTETEIIGRGGVIAAGIGINANNAEFSKDIENKATSVFIHSGKKQDIAEIIISVYNEFLKIYNDFNCGFSKIADEYKKKCITLNHEIVIIKDGKSQIMTAKGISEKGELLAERNGETKVINSGEVSVRGIMGYI